MTTITLKINEKSKAGKTLLSMVHFFTEEKNGVEILKEPSERNVSSKKVLQDLDLAFKQLTTVKKSNLKRKTLDELLNEK